MKKFILAASTVMFLTLTAFAQDNNCHPKNCEKKCETKKECKKDSDCKKKCEKESCTTASAADCKKAESKSCCKKSESKKEEEKAK